MSDSKYLSRYISIKSDFKTSINIREKTNKIINKWQTKVWDLFSEHNMDRSKHLYEMLFIEAIRETLFIN